MYRDVERRVERVVEAILDPYGSPEPETLYDEEEVDGTTSPLGLDSRRVQLQDGAQTRLVGESPRRIIAKGAGPPARRRRRPLGRTREDAVTGGSMDKRGDGPCRRKVRIARRGRERNTLRRWESTASVEGRNGIRRGRALEVGPESSSRRRPEIPLIVEAADRHRRLR